MNTYEPKEPNLKDLAQRYPHLYLTEEELGLVYAKDPVRTSLRAAIEDQRAKMEDYKARMRAYQDEQNVCIAEITRLKASIELEVKKLDTQRRIARGAYRGTEHLIYRSRKAIEKAMYRYSLRNIQLFKMVVNKRLSAEKKTLRLSRGRRAAMGLPEAIVDVELPPEPQPDRTDGNQKA